MLSLQGGIGQSRSAASKSGVAGQTDLLANEWASRRINLNAIAPGSIAASNTAAFHADEVRNRQALERIPAGCWGQPSDLAGATIYLASDASDVIHGDILALYRGWLAR